MAEGPSITILRDVASRFVGHTIQQAGGNAKIETSALVGRRVEAVRSFGKQFLLALPDNVTIRVHLLMFGSYRIDERKDAPPRLSLGFDNGELNFYSCSVRLLEGDLDHLFDWRTDVMSDQWDAKLARAKLRAAPQTLVCDALLDQNIFAGVGNIIKNEVLYRVRIHPLSQVGALPPRKLRELVEQARAYTFEFLAWKKAFVLRKHWLVHKRRQCPKHGIPLRLEHLGKTNRRSFYCERCQKLYVAKPQ